MGNSNRGSIWFHRNNFNEKSFEKNKSIFKYKQSKLNVSDFLDNI